VASLQLMNIGMQDPQKRPSCIDLVRFSDFLMQQEVRRLQASPSAQRRSSRQLSMSSAASSGLPRTGSQLDAPQAADSRQGAGPYTSSSPGAGASSAAADTPAGKRAGAPGSTTGSISADMTPPATGASANVANGAVGGHA